MSSTTSSPVQQRPPRGRRKSWVEEQSIFWFRVTCVLVGLILRFWVRCYSASGMENVPRSGGAFIICNHTTGMDPFLLGYPIRDLMPRGPGKIELFQQPIFAYLMRKIGMFPLRQNVADVAAVRTMIDLYRHGRLVIVYPEGGRSPSSEMRPFNPDFARLMLKLKARIVPAAVAGGNDLLPIGSRIPRPHTPVTVVFGEPFDLSQHYDGKPTPETIQEASNLMQARVAALLEIAQHERDRISKTC